MKIIWPLVDIQKGDNQPGGVSVISAILKKAGFTSEATPADLRSVVERIPKGERAILAFSTPTVFAQTNIALSCEVKKLRDVTSVFGGPHPTYFPEMIEEDGVDAICVGEGEEAMLELALALRDGGPLHGISNLHLKENGRVIRNPLRPLVEDLDSLPIPDHDIFLRASRGTIWRALVLASRGCPYRCTFCYNHLYRKIYEGKGKVLRRRSVDHVIEELSQIKLHREYRFIKFMDDLFILDPQWVEEFSRKYRAIGLPFSCLLRANHVTEDIVRNLKEAGCFSVCMGIEAGSDRVRNEVLRRNMPKEEIVRASSLIHKHGIKLVAGNIAAVPGSTLEEEFETLDLNIRCKVDFPSVTFLQPYPRTEIYDLASKLGLLGDVSGVLRNEKVQRVSSLRFPNLKEKRLVHNFRELFPLVVKFPALRPFLKFLIRLPLGPLYSFIFRRLWNVNDYLVSTPPRIGLRNFHKRSRLYFWLKGLAGGGVA